MAIFDEPSREPLPQPTFEDAAYASRKGLVSMIPFVGGVGAELVGLLTSPVAQRRDAWLEDLERRLHDLEGRVDGFRFDDLGQNEQFVSATLQATQAALRTHQKEKLAALRNAVMNVAVAKAPSENLQVVFLNLVESFTPMHLEILRFFQHRETAALEELRRRGDLSDLVVRDLNDRGLIKDTRPYIARNRDAPESLVFYQWDVTNLGKQFLEFITSPEKNKNEWAVTP
jgi:hypothetical protein